MPQYTLALMQRTAQIVLALLCIGAWPSGWASTADADGMARLYQSLQPRLATSPFQRPLVLDSTEVADRTAGDIYAMLDVALPRLALVNHDPVRWCEILLLLSNTKHCAVGAADGAPTLRLRMGTKGPQALSSTTAMDFRFATSAANAAVLESVLRSSSGPMGTEDGMLSLRAIALGTDQSFIHLHYSYRNSLGGRMATAVYLQTLGRGKVGFSPERVAPTAQAAPPAPGPLVGGVRGIIERNTMRYFLGLHCALQLAWVDAPAQRFTQMAACWFSGTEQYPRQLYEMPRQDYLDMKQAEYARVAPTN